MNKQLSTNFNLSELLITSTGLSNEPNEEEIRNLTFLVQRLLQPLRTELGVPLVITSGFRSAAVNAAIHGSPTSDHRHGRAADFLVNGKPTSQRTVIQLWRAIQKRKLVFDQLIVYCPEKGSHCHISYRHNQENRKEVLYLDKHGKYWDVAELIAERLPN